VKRVDCSYVEGGTGHSTDSKIESALDSGTVDVILCLGNQG